MGELPPEVQKRVNMQGVINKCEGPRDSWEYLGIELICVLDRIAVALEKIEETGVYVYQQGTEEEPKERRRG